MPDRKKEGNARQYKKSHGRVNKRDGTVRVTTTTSNEPSAPPGFSSEGNSNTGNNSSGRE